MAPNVQQELVFENECNCTVDYDILKKAMLWYANGRVLKRLRKIYMHGKYPAVSVYNSKIQVHRLLMQYKIKSKIPNHLYVHHIDGNKNNCSMYNLKLMDISTHQSFHNKGKTLSADHKSKIAIKNTKRKGSMYKIRRTDIGVNEVVDLFKSGLSPFSISKKINLSYNAVMRRLKQHDKETEANHG